MTCIKSPFQRSLWTNLDGLIPAGKVEDGHYINTTDYPPQSNSDYTILSYDLSGAQLDFQVEALVGHNSSVFVPDHPLARMDRWTI